MRVLFLSHSPHLAGAERMMLNMALRLKREHGVRPLILIYGKGPFAEAATKEGLEVHILANPAPWYLRVKDFAEESCEHLHLANQCALEIAEVGRKWAAEALVINTLTNLPGLFAAARLNIPYLLWAHGIIDHSLIPLEWEQFKWACDGLLVKCASARLCPSQWTASYFSAQFNAPFDVAPNFTPVPEKVGPCTTALPTFCCLSTWEENKGVKILFEAVAKLRAKSLIFKVVLHGAGLQEKELRKKLEDLKLQDFVQMAGRTSDPRAVYRNSHALVTPSMLESFGMTMIEANAEGRPVIASATSGHLEVLQDGENGFLCPVGDVDAFASKMEWVINHPFEAAALGRKGWEIARDKYSGTLSARIFYDSLSKMIAAEHEKDFEQLRDRYYPCRPLLAMTQRAPFTSTQMSSEPDAEGHFRVRQPGRKVAMIPSLALLPNLVPALTPPHIEEILCSTETLHGMTFYIGTHSRVAHGFLKLRIYHAGSRQLLREASLDLSTAKDNTPVSFYFPGIHGVSGQCLRIDVSSQADGPISLYAEPAVISGLWSKVKKRLKRLKHKLHIVLHE